MQFDIAIKPNIPAFLYQQALGTQSGRRKHLQNRLCRLSDFQIVKPAGIQKIININSNRKVVAHGNNHRKAINQAILNLKYNEINSYYYLFNIRKTVWNFRRPCSFDLKPILVYSAFKSATHCLSRASKASAPPKSLSCSSGLILPKFRICSSESLLKG